MRRWGLLASGAVVLAAAVVLASGCGRTHYIPEGALEVHNEWTSDSTISGIEIDEVYGPNFLAYDVWAPPGDRIVVDVFPSLYDVTLYWADGGWETFLDVSVEECCTTTIDARR